MTAPLGMLVVMCPLCNDGSSVFNRPDPSLLRTMCSNGKHFMSKRAFHAYRGEPLKLFAEIFRENTQDVMKTIKPKAPKRQITL
jgi:hypothetical protein